MVEVILTLDSIGRKVFIVLVNTSLQAILLILVVWFIIWIFRLSSATTRYYLCFLAVFGILSLPLFSELLPGVNFQIIGNGEVISQPAHLKNNVSLDKGTINSAKIESKNKAVSEEAYSNKAKEIGLLMERRREIGANNPRFRGLLNLSNTILLVWFVVTSFMFYRLITSYRWLMHLRRKSLKVKEGRILSIISRLRERLNVTGKIDLFISSEIHSPTSFGLFSTTIILPESLVIDSTDELEMVLTHELAHAKRHDFLVNLLQRALQSIFFFHPLFQMASRRLTREREHICDDWVIQATGRRDDYAECLINLVERAICRPKTISMAMMGHTHNITRRIDMIIDDTRSIITGISRKAGVAILLIGCLLLPLLSATKVVYTAESSTPLFAAPGQLNIPTEPAARLGRGNVEELAYSPDGKLIAVAGGIGVWLCQGEDLTEICLLKGHTGYVTSVSFSPDGTLLASGSYDRTIRLWDVGAKKEVAALRGHTDKVNSVSFSPDGKLLASGAGWDRDDNTVRLWDVELQKEIAVLRGHTDDVTSVSFSPDGKLLASGGEWNDKTIRLWDVETRKEVVMLKGHGLPVLSVSFSPDGQLLASADYNTIRVWDLAKRKEIDRFGGLYTASFSPDGKLLAYVRSGQGLEGIIRIRDVETRQEIAMLTENLGLPKSVLFSPDGIFLVSGCSAAVRLWEVESEKEVAMLSYSANIDSLSFSPDSKLLASSHWDYAVRLWDVEMKGEIGALRGYDVSSVAFNPDGKLLAVGDGKDGNIRLWDVAQRKEVDVLKGHTHHVWSVSFSPDGSLLASGGSDATVRLWDVEQRKEIATLKGHEANNWVESVSFSPDGNLLASGSTDSTVRIWDVKERKEIAALHAIGSSVSSVSFSPDGKLLASGDGWKAIRLWDVETKETIANLHGHDDCLTSVSFSPDGKFLASGSKDKTVRLWDVEKKQEIAVLGNHMDYVFSVCFSPDGKWLASGSRDGTVLLWEVNIEVPGWSAEPIEKKTVIWGKIKRTALYQNYPNPFNPETWIPFELAQASDVTIDIYTQSGQSIQTLSLGHKEAGAYRRKNKAAYWDGRNSNGEEVASGVYFYTMEAGKFKTTRKMVIAR